MEKMSDSDPIQNKWRLDDDEKLLLQMLLSKKEWIEKTAEKKDSGKTPRRKKETQIPSSSAVSWNLSPNIALYPWQKTCIDLWFEKNGHGTVKVVTGAGKTILALSIIERLKNEKEPDLRVAIIVPTIVLMHQWFDEFKENTTIPAEYIGFLGGTYDDRFEDKKILICVINSAQKKLPKIVEEAKAGDRLLLIVDECHRSGSDVMSNIYKTQRKYSLGLSATPERETDPTDVEDEEKSDLITFGEPTIIFDEQLVGKEIGPIIFELNLNDAYNQGILPSFEIRHYGLQLPVFERSKYEALTKEIREIKKHLLEDKRSQKYISERDFNLWLNRKSKNEGALTVQKLQYLTKVQERKKLLYQSKARKEAVLTLLKKDLEYNPKSRILIFHEIIEESMEIWNILKEAKIHALPENSKLSETVRSENIELFRQNVSNVLVSVKALVEGFNVPSVDTGIIVASSSSVRQRIQTLGRLLRRYRSLEGKEKHSVINVFYIANTVDDRIYSKVNWATITGADRNTYFTWDILQRSEPVPQIGPPRTPPSSDNDIDESKLQPGSEYPGVYEGVEFSADSQGNVYFEGDRNKPIQNPQGIPEQIQKIKNALGRFRVSPNKLYVIIRIPLEGEWKNIFITKLNEPFRYITHEKSESSTNIESLSAGMEIQNFSSKNPTRSLIYKRKGNDGLIAEKIPRGERYARTSNNAEDPIAGQQADELKKALNEVENKLNRKISKFFIDLDNIAYTFIDGKTIFIIKLDHILEFPKSDLLINKPSKDVNSQERHLISLS
jgi:superfamily II DNA or RNA helicase